MEKKNYIAGGIFVHNYYKDRIDRKIQLSPFSKKIPWIRVFFYTHRLCFIPFLVVLLLKKGRIFKHKKNSEVYYFGHASVDEKKTLDIADLKLSSPSFWDVIVTMFCSIKYKNELMKSFKKNQLEIFPELFYFILVYILHYVYFYRLMASSSQTTIVVVDDYVPELVGGLVAGKDNHLFTKIYSLHYRPETHSPPIRVDELIYWKGSGIQEYTHLAARKSHQVKNDFFPYKKLESLYGLKVVVLLNAFYDKNILLKYLESIKKYRFSTVAVRFHPRSKDVEFQSGFNIDNSINIQEMHGKYDLALSMCSYSAMEILNIGVPVIVDKDLENNEGLLEYFFENSGLYVSSIEDSTIEKINDFYLAD